MTAPDYGLLALFLTVADTRNFTEAAQRLGITRSAVSQGVRKLEDQLGVALAVRTTRNLRLTETGARFAARLRTPLAELDGAMAEASDRAQPRGHLRLVSTSIAERFLSGGLIASFAAAYPDITLDITVSDDEGDIVSAGFDAGVRLGEVIEQDMIAVALSGPQRQVAVASPTYIEAHGAPLSPHDLVDHRCIGWRSQPENAPYRWEFAQNGHDFDVAVNPQITTNDMLLMIRIAVAGGGISFGMEETYQPYLARGELVRLLGEFLPEFPGFYFYFPSRRNMEPKLRVFADHCRAYARASEN
jgi:DNA-binding transcriptional LysR family regulator